MRDSKNLRLRHDALKEAIELLEVTTSMAIPAIPKPFATIRRARPNTITGLVDKLRGKGKRLLRRHYKNSPPLPQKI